MVAALNLVPHPRGEVTRTALLVGNTVDALICGGESMASSRFAEGASNWLSYQMTGVNVCTEYSSMHPCSCASYVGCGLARQTGRLLRAIFIDSRWLDSVQVDGRSL